MRRPSLYRTPGNEEDLAYMRSLAAAVVQRSPRYMVNTLLIMALIIICAITWMSIAELDVVVRGNGKVIPSQQLQVLQSLEGGVVSEILVKEGEVVEQNQPLIKISDIAFSSSLEENKIHYLELRARMVRLRAEADETPFEPAGSLLQAAATLVEAERSLFETNQQQLRETLEILTEQMRQSESELLEANAKRRQLKKSLSLMREELSLKKPLLARKLVSEVEYLQLQQKEAEMEGDLQAVTLSKPRIESKIEEARRKIEQAKLDFRNKAKKELNEVTAETSRISETQGALKDRVQRTVLRAPVKGTITRLHMNTIGGVVQPSTPILEIVPLEDALLVEINIKPSDIANITTGQLARLKFTAYDYSIYGSLPGKVIFLSADTITNEDGHNFFVARIKPEKSYIEHQSNQLPIRVGMTAEADIVTNRKSILQYLFKPIGRGIQRALHEE